MTEAIDELGEAMNSWRLPEGGDDLSGRVNYMIRRELWQGWFGQSPARFLLGEQYHLGGRQDTAELAALARVGPEDAVLDVACFLGGPARQLAGDHGCRVTGIDLSENCIRAADHITSLCGLDQQVSFCVADAGWLPFSDGAFSVVWSQCSLRHSETWLTELRRLLARGGRLALTFDIRRDNPQPDSPRWTLADIVSLLMRAGFVVEWGEDITERDIEIGWQALTAALRQRESELVAALGEKWVAQAYSEFATEARRMSEGEWGNARLVARKDR